MNPTQQQTIVDYIESAETDLAHIRNTLGFLRTLVTNADTATASEQPTKKRPLKTPPPLIEHIVNAVCQTWDVTPFEIIQHTRLRVPTEARQAALYLACQCTHHTRAELTRWFQREPICIKLACKTVTNRLATEPQFVNLIRDLKESIRSTNSHDVNLRRVDPAVPTPLRPRVSAPLR